MTFVDHLMMLLLFVAQPVSGRFAWNRLLARIEAGEPISKARLYRETLYLEWIALTVLVSVWLVFGRPFSDLGFVDPAGNGFVAGAAIFAVAVVYLVYAWRAARHASSDDIEKVRSSIGDLGVYLPDTPASYRGFMGVSVTAGICEEIIYRGFAFWYLAHFLPLWAVVLVSSVAFGLGHSYQGAAGMLRTGLIGLAFGLFYLLTGSIWLPILAHAVLDILQGAMLREYLRDRGDAGPLQPAPPAG